MSSLTLRASMVVISDRVELHRPWDMDLASSTNDPDLLAPLPPVAGSYLERLPLAAIRGGIAEQAEIWHFCLGSEGAFKQDTPLLGRRVFPLGDSDNAPFRSDAMLNFIQQHGAPRVLCVLGLGVDEAILEACRDSVIIYNSIDAPALRVAPDISRHFDLVLTGAQWQSDVVTARHPGMATAILPVGPDFASPETFFPTGDTRLYDIVYVAAAQPYKRHDVLFGALARAPKRLRALCVMGYGEEADALRRQAAELELDVTFVGPPGVPYDEVNRLMNQARVGVVCGVDDGAPAILTEYMLAGLPVVANAELACGLQYILPETGLIASVDRFEHALIEAIDNPDRFNPREAVIARWAWPHSIAKLKQLLVDLTTKTDGLAPTPTKGGSFEQAGSV